MKIRSLRQLLFAGLLGLASHTALSHPSAGIVIDAQGSVFFSDLSRGLFKISPEGTLTKFGAEGGHYLALDLKGSFSSVEFEKSPHWPRWFKRRTPIGARPTLIADGGSPLVVAPDGNLYYICNDEQMVPGGVQLARLTPRGQETLVSPGLVRITGEMGSIKGLAVAPHDSLFIAYSKAVFRVARDGTITTLLNPVVVPECDVRAEATLGAPSLHGLVADASGTLYLAATGCACVIKITPDKKVTTVLKSERPWAPSGVTLHGDDLYVLEHVNPDSNEHEAWQPRVRKMTRDGKVTTLATLPP